TIYNLFFFFQAEDGIRDFHVTGVQTCALPISAWDLTFPGPNNMFVFTVDPLNPNIVYTSSSNGHITKWDVSVSPAQPANISINRSEERRVGKECIYEMAM